jgi:HK97 gp10 family phage protein
MPDTPTINADARSAIKGLEDLERKVAKKYVKKGLREACKVTLKRARSTAPVASGQVKRNIKVRGAKSTKYLINMVVGLAQKWFTGPTFYAAFVAFGHRIGRRQLGDSRKEVPANEWLDKAYESTKTTAVERFREVITDLIENNTE